MTAKKTKTNVKLTRIEERTLKSLQRYGPQIFGITPMRAAAWKLVDKGLVRYSRYTECHSVIE